jgi:hypothetical protein
MEIRGCHAIDRMLVGFTSTYAISAYHHYRCEFQYRSWRGLLFFSLLKHISRQVLCKISSHYHDNLEFHKSASQQIIIGILRLKGRSFSI